MRRAAAAKAIAEGREPGRKGCPKQFTEVERQAKQNARVLDYYWRNAEAIRPVAAKRERDKRAAKKAGTYIFRPLGYAKLSPEEKRLQNIRFAALRRARLRNASGSFTEEDVERLYNLQHGKCAFCLKLLGDDVHLDHYVPLARDGSNDPSNLRLLHEKCNLTKADKHPIEHAMENGMLCW
jgi:HNH endonuclease